jgi:hypothetical protein
MGVIQFTPRVTAFQAGGLQPDYVPGGIGLPPMQGLDQPDPSQMQPPPAAPAPPQAPAIQTGPGYGAFAQAAGLPVSGQATPIGTAPPPAEEDVDDNAVNKQALDEDAKALDNTLSHYGDNRFLTPMPKQQDYRTDPEYQTLQAAQEYIQQHAGTRKPAEIARAYNMVKAKQTALQKRYDNDYKSQYNQWKLSEAEQLKGIEGDKLTGTGLEQNWATADTARDTIAKNLTEIKGPNADLEKAGAATTNMAPSNFSETTVRLGQFNNLPPQRASELVMHLAAPNGAYNGRKGVAAANYKVIGSDAVGNVWLQTDGGKIRVPPNTYDQINRARQKGYFAIKKIEQQRKTTPPTRTIGQWVNDQIR